MGEPFIFLVITECEICGVEIAAMADEPAPKCPDCEDDARRVEAADALTALAQEEDYGY